MTPPKRRKKPKNKTITGDDAFQLYDTYGFPIDLTQLMAQERGLSVDIAGFDKFMEQQRSRARAAQKGAQFLVTLADAELPATEDLHKYKTNRLSASIVASSTRVLSKRKGSSRPEPKSALSWIKPAFTPKWAARSAIAARLTPKRANLPLTRRSRSLIASSPRTPHRGILTVGDKVTATVSPDRDATRKKPYCHAPSAVGPSRCPRHLCCPAGKPGLARITCVSTSLIPRRDSR